MSGREEIATQLFVRGDYIKLVRAFAETSANNTSETAPTRLLVAHALAVTGELAAARRLATAVLNTSRVPSEGARARLVLGLTDERAGRFDDALKEYENALGLISDATSPNLAGWIRLYRFRLFTEGHPMKALTAMIPTLRKVVTKAGDPQLTAYLHMCIAVLEGETGHPDEAHRHASTASELLMLSENKSLESANHINRGCLDILNGRLANAALQFRKAKSLACETGDRFIASRADGNLAHLHLFAGELTEARELFESTLRDGTFGKLGEIGAIDGLARVYLTAGDLNACASSLRKVESLRTTYEAHDSIYPVRWAGLTKARLLYRQSLFQECSIHLSYARETTRAVQDIPFNASVALLTALVASRLQAHVTAASELFAACQLGAHGMRELQPQLYHVASAVVDEDDRYLSQALQQRADRLWDAQGIVSTRVELDDHGTNLDGARRALASARTRPPHPPRTIQTMTSAIAAALDLAHTPRLCGLELLSIIHALGCSPDARLLESTDPIHADDRYATLALGSDAGATVTLVCRLPDRPAQALLLADVLRLGSAALMLDVAKREARNRAALWPASPAEEQAGALFVAEEMQALLALVRRIAPTNVPVLITGETGTGKEVLARTVHAYSGRARKPFVPFNCSATPREMLDAQLFGHRKGAFTGATEHFPGVIRAANGGTLFLDEIGETTLDLQPKLLRFLEAGEVHPIGDTQPTHVDVRIIAATNADLDELVAQARFRDDLFYRLNIVRLHVPPLRSRREEIPLLAQHYLDKYSQEAGKHGLRLAEETVEYLVLYRWPGNVRQLANEMRRLCALADTGAVLMPEHLSAPIAASRRTVPPSQRTLEATEVVVRLDQPLAAATAHLERALILYALQQCHGAMEATAGALGLSRKGLYLKRQRLGIEVAPLS